MSVYLGSFSVKITQFPKGAKSERHIIEPSFSGIPSHKDSCFNRTERSNLRNTESKKLRLLLIYSKYFKELT